MDDSDFDKRMKRLHWMNISANVFIVLTQVVLVTWGTYQSLEASRLSTRVDALVTENAQLRSERMQTVVRGAPVKLLVCRRPGVTIRGRRAYDVHGEPFLEVPEGSTLSWESAGSPNCPELQQDGGVR